MLVDIAIIVAAISSFFRGREIGFVRQAFSSLGFFGGLLLGSYLQHFTVAQASTIASRSVITVVTTLGTAILFLAIGEYIGLALKRRVIQQPLNAFDITLGGLLSIVSLLATIWLGSSIIASLPSSEVLQAVQKSRIVRTLNNNLPSAPSIIADLSRLIDPNGFPQVFIGGEPGRARDVPLPDLGQLTAAVNRTKPSVVKVEGQGCGGIVEGSGFIIGSGLVATNAHVVAGIKKPYVQDSNGTHSATAIWFNPNLDFAILRVSNLAGRTLPLQTNLSPSGTPAAVLGYPGGGGFSAKPSAVVDSFIARGRNIYGSGVTRRQIYEMKADIIPGNSGGPVITEDGSVIGVVFAQSTTYANTGYALTAAQVAPELRQAEAGNRTVSTGNCAE